MNAPSPASESGRPRAGSRPVPDHQDARLSTKISSRPPGRQAFVLTADEPTATGGLAGGLHHEGRRRGIVRILDEGRSPEPIDDAGPRP